MEDEMGYREKMDEWLNSEFIDEDTKNELRSLTDEKEV